MRTFLFFLILTITTSGGWCQAAVYNVRVTNVTDSKFTVSWVSDTSESGRIEYGEEPGVLNRTQTDVRGNTYAGHTHYVEVCGDNITAGRVYYCRIISGDTTYPDGAYFCVKTGPTLESLPPPPDQRGGRVFLLDGEPAVNTIIYATLLDGDRSGTRGSSQTLSCLVTEENDGCWIFNFGSCRSRDLGSYFNSIQGDRVELYAQGGEKGMAHTWMSPGDLDLKDLTDLPSLFLGSVPLKGDVNFDGIVDIHDFVQILGMAAGIIPDDVPVADMDGDKSVSIADAIRVRSLIITP